MRRQSATVVTFPAGPREVFQGGAFLTGASLGDLATTSCTVIPEIALSASLQCCECMRIFCGTSMLYLPQVAYSPNQIEIGVDTSRSLPGQAGGPQRPMNTSPDLRSGFLCTVVSAGLEFRF